ncbi:hypothetical protein SSX86_004510 [Deinandra increscens subsp. villosa]|uniref:DUF6821 domain-containing protein n=1 Tax=Deinandra increscens subsp. villosa TaxID=3103831 RepID=A0AAP0DNQ0_9ASTR
MDVELHDWEVLDDSNSDQDTAYLDGIERGSEGIIRSDHFSLDSLNFSATQVPDVSDHVSVDSDNPSWIDPVCDANYSTTEPIGEFSSTDGSSDDGKYGESDSNRELGVVEFASRQVDCADLLPDSDEDDAKSSVCEKIDEESEQIVEGRDEGNNENMKADGEERSVVAVWWKLPFDLLKYCLFRASPVWTLSAAAAMMGVVILGRRLYKMRQKTRTLQLQVTVDDKKVSQVMSRVARLNEAFSVVKRAPIVRPSLPAAGIAPWPMMALR